MGYRNLQQCVDDLERTGQLVRISTEIDPHLEMAEIHRRVYQAGGPALLFENVKGCRFPMVSNLFGTLERGKFLFRDMLRAVEHMIELKIDPNNFFKNPWRYRDIARPALSMLPRHVGFGPATTHETTIDQLPQLVCWPNDGGSFVTLPEVYTEDPASPGLMNSNLGMYRVQLAGNDYQLNQQVGLHYQIHRSIGVHHAKALERSEPFRVNIFVGGSPAMMLAAVMPLPEGMSELTFAGALSGRAIRMIRQKSRPAIYAEADFVITGTIDPKTLPEGPFGDHLGYYAKVHDFPVLNVEKVYHRPNAIWPFTVVGRPPQEDTTFGELIHELTGPAIPTVLPGVHGVHAVDAAGVHPLLLAIGSERYVPYAEQRRPQELLTIANAILGQGQLSLAKYLFIVAKEDNPQLELEDIPAFFDHVLRRVDWTRDLHFQTRTTIDTLDYSGSGFNEGSKVVIAAAGPPRRELPIELKECTFPEGFHNPKVLAPGILVLEGPAYSHDRTLEGDRQLLYFCSDLPLDHPLNEFPLVIVTDDSAFAAQSWHNFLWTTFTRSNPATDIYGVQSFTEDKHWACKGSLIIDARTKPHHAPPLVEDPAVSRRVDELGVQGGPLAGLY
ncbi:UbiD family decarboxylase [Calycomorphotria hydatis]|uniref:4-hydroxybenzoate decarboxylase subunit C n=1 Tax=Calycomorphotria hydatis TaxID=2528027 RepID=A0A517TBV9_9PLAN|nr:UbiD family decarboxylase [Calycomorphotria hydatis]QDT65862.1 4-hydroxybenzoate decarboxylase subunit C [Calycomorphotria hydatis]